MRRLLNTRPLRILAWVLIAPYGLALLYWIVPPPSTLMLVDIFTLQFPRRDWVSLEEISPNLIASVVAAEDGAFCDHFGFDFKQLEASFDRAERGRKLRGASTITQQTAKNLFLWNGRSWVRKILETPLALWLEMMWSKKRILEVYLNIAQWGDNIYGAQAAARYHFATDASKLSLTQSALLAAALPNPVRRSAARPGSGQLMQASIIVGRVARHTPDLSCVR